MSIFYKRYGAIFLIKEREEEEGMEEHTTYYKKLFGCICYKKREEGKE